MVLFYRIVELIHRLVSKWRAGYLRSRMDCGKGVVLGEDALVYCPERVRIADGVYIGPRVTIMAHGGVELGESSMLGPCVTILSVNHDYTKEKPTVRSSQRKRPVTIGREVFIAGGAIVLPGVTIGDNSAVSAGSVVNADVPPNSIVAGIPAKLIRERYRNTGSGKPSLPLFDEENVFSSGEGDGDEGAADN